MKIQVTQTLPNGQVTQQVLSREGVEVLKIQALPGAKISFNVEGAKPSDSVNAKIKTGNIKKVGNNLVLESEGEQLVEVTDFYSTPGASVGNVGWDYAATDAGVMTATPEAQALQSGAAVSESGALLPAIAPGWLVAGGVATVAAVANGRDSSGVPDAGKTVISGAVVLGPVKAGNGLIVTLFKADGTELAATTVGDDGKFTVSYSAAYTGVVMARVRDTTPGADYRDEATNADKDLGSDIRALFSTKGAGATNITLSALSEMAVRQILGDSGGDNGSSAVAAGAKTAVQIAAKNAELAVSLGLTGNVVTDFVINPTVNADGTAAAPNAAGLLVAALSGLDLVYGAGGALDLLATKGTTSTALIELVAEGAQQAGVLATLSTAVTAVGAVAAAAASTATALDTSTLNSTTLATLSPLVVAQFSAAQVAAIPDAAMAGLTVSQLAALTGDQVAVITTTQVDNLTAAQITALGADVSGLSADAIASLDAAQVQALSGAQLNALATVSAPTSAHALSSDTTPTLTGTFTGKLPAGAEIHVYDGTTDLGIAVVTAAERTWSFTPTAALITQGAHTFTAQIQVANGSSATASAAFVLTLDSVAPTVTAAYTTNENAGADTTAHTITLVGTDANGPVTFSGLTGADASKFSLNTSTGVLTFVGQTNYEVADDAGEDHVYDVSVVGTDSAGNTVTQVITITVNDVNEAPTPVSTIAAQTAVKNQNAWSLNLANYFTDVDAGDALAYTLTSGTLPAGLTLTNGVISGAPTAEVTATSYTITATDKAGLKTAQTFSLGVVAAPVVQSFTVVDATGVTTKGKGGESATFEVTFSEGVNFTSAFSATFTVGGQTVTATSTQTSDASTNGLNKVSFTANVPSTGDGTFILTAFSGGGTVTGKLSGQSMVTYAGSLGNSGYTVDNTLPAITTTSFNVDENATSFTGSGALTATDSNGPVTWALGAGGDEGLFNLTDGVLSLKAAKNYEIDATSTHKYTVNVVATDAVGNTSNQAVTVNLKDVNEAPVVSATAISDVPAVTGTAYTTSTPLLDISTYFTDPESAALTYSLGSGAPSWLKIDASTGKLWGTAPGAETADLAVIVNVTDGVNSVSKTFNIDVISAPSLSVTLTSTTVLDVRSKIIFSVSEEVTANTGGKITLTDLGTSKGFRGEAAGNHTQEIDVTDTNRVQFETINGKHYIAIDPLHDLDLSSTYSLSVSTGAFKGVTSKQNSVDFTTVSFGTVDPGAGLVNAVQAQEMSTDTAKYGTLQNSLKWFDASNIGDASGSSAPTDLELSSANYAVTFKEIDPGAGGILEGQGAVKLLNFDANDLVYVDSQDHTLTNVQATWAGNLFSGGDGTSADPFQMSVGGDGTLGSYAINIILSQSAHAALPPTPWNDQLLNTVISNHWSNTGMVIAA